MANNEVSGPVLATALGRWLGSLKKMRYTYRMVFIPETIGSITYLSRNLQEMKKHTVAGFNLTCVGDDRTYSYLPSRQGGTLADRVLLHVLKHHAPDFKRYSFLDRGGDERQYCAPGIDLPLAVFCRSKFGEYAEYHTSLDNLDVICAAGLAGSFGVMTKVLRSLELNKNYRATVLGEPQLGKRGLYPSISIKESYAAVERQMNLLAYADGSPLLDIAEKIGVPAWELSDTVEKLVSHGLLSSEN
jgi:aminopeptidase-like protein